jgi:hypothetical protein
MLKCSQFNVVEADKMSAITDNFIDENQREVDSLHKLILIYTLTSMASGLYLSFRAAIIWIDSKMLLSEIKNLAAGFSTRIDESGIMTERLQIIQSKARDIYLLIKNKNAHLFFSPLILSLLKMAFNNYNLAIINITEHDADMDIAQGAVSGPFYNVDDVMKHLDS